MKKLFFVMNPYAGMRKANRVLVEILEKFNRAGYDVITYMTSGSGDAHQVVRQRAAEMDLIVCCGGDGTFNEVISGLIESGCDVPVGYIPAGSTNDFANSLGLPTNPVEAAQRIANGKPEAFDAGSFGGRHFTYVASFGIFTKASYTTPQSVKNALGHTAYILSGIKELSNMRKLHLRMDLDDEIIEGDYIFGAICNSTSVGGVITLNPSQVDMSDGLFEILLVRAPKDLKEITDCIAAVQKQTYDCQMMTFRSAGKVTVHAQADMDWTLDGEREPGHEVVEVENLHNVFRLVK